MNRIRWRPALYGAWPSPFTNFTAIFERFLAPESPGRERERMPVLYVHMRASKHFVQGGKHIGVKVCEGSL